MKPPRTPGQKKQQSERKAPGKKRQPTSFTRERVVEAAFDLIREEGWQSMSARAIAKRLGSSTMPIYSHLRSVAEVERALRGKAYALLKDYQQRSWTPDPSMDMAFGYIAFARDEPHLFRFLYIERPDVIGEEGLEKLSETYDDEFGAEAPEHEALAALSRSARNDLMQNSWIFTHGLAVLVNSGALGECSDEMILRFLGNAGEAFYIWAAGRSGSPQGSDNGGTNGE
ncbi:MAG: TetR/AcrR family transcriptional regulator [Spirochaetales bacterium]